MKNFRLESVILAIGLLLLGICIKGGFDSFAERDRSVNVKGLAEEEVPADKVTWPLVYKVMTWAHCTMKSSVRTKPSCSS